MAHEVVVLGGGVGGTLLANLLARRLRPAEAHVIVVDASGRHVYQPGWLYVPFGEEKPEKLVRPERRLLDRRVDLIVQPARRIEPRRQQVILADGSTVAYDTLVIATGAVLAPDAVSGYTAGAHHFYSEEAARALGETLARFTGGRLVIGVADIPYRCPPAPLEFAFKVEEYLTRRGLRDRTEIIYLSPINRVFTIESVSAFVAPLLEQRGIRSETFFNVERVDAERQVVTSLEGAEIAYDLLVLIPPHRGAAVVRESGLGDAQGWLPTDRATLQVKGYENIYGLGDATDVPVSKSGSAAHFEAKALAERLTALIRTGRPPATNGTYDGSVLCFLETGYGQASQLAFDFTHPPTPPAPNAFYHYEKLLFNRLYWHIVPRGLV